jgi:hypothetical protein
VTSVTGFLFLSDHRWDDLLMAGRSQIVSMSPPVSFSISLAIFYRTLTVREGIEW